MFKLKLRIEVPGVTPFEAETREVVPLISLSRVTGRVPLAVYVDPANHSTFAIDWSGTPSGYTVGAGGTTRTATVASASMDISDNPKAQEALARVLRQYGLDEPGVVDVRQSSEMHEALVEALRDAGVEMPAPDSGSAAGSAMRGDHASRLQELQRLKDAGLITDAEYIEQRARILREI